MENEIIKKYFLGLLNPTETKQVELRILEEDSLEAELIQSENSLIEDYLNVNLANDEIIAFNQNYLITRERRKKVEFIRLIKAYNRKHLLFPDKKPRLSEKIKAIFKTPAVSFGIIPVVILIFLLIGWLTLNNPKNSEIANLNNQDFSNLSQFESFTIVNLSSERLRGTNTEPLAQQKFTEKVMFRLALPLGVQREQKFSVSILRNGVLLEDFSQNALQNQEIRLLLPKSLLKVGEYKISLRQGSATTDYYFVVQ